MSPQVDDKILDRLSKLLAMAERGDEHEAKIAAGRAADLMAKYQLELADVVGRGEAKVTVERGRIDADDDSPLSRVENWHRRLAAAICDVVGGRMWFAGSSKRQQFFMVGPPDTVRTARYMYLHLAKQVGRLSREAGKRHGETSNAWRRSYALGMVQRIWERMKVATAQVMSNATSTALVHVSAQKKAVDDAIEEMELRKARSGKRKRPDAGSWGYNDGKDVDIGSADAPRLGPGQKKLT